MTLKDKNKKCMKMIIKNEWSKYENENKDDDEDENEEL